MRGVCRFLLKVLDLVIPWWKVMNSKLDYMMHDMFFSTELRWSTLLLIMPHSIQYKLHALTWFSCRSLGWNSEAHRWPGKHPTSNLPAPGLGLWLWPPMAPWHIVAHHGWWSPCGCAKTIHNERGGRRIFVWVVYVAIVSRSFSAARVTFEYRDQSRNRVRWKARDSVQRRVECVDMK